MQAIACWTGAAKHLSLRKGDALAPHSLGGDLLSVGLFLWPDPWSVV